MFDKIGRFKVLELIGQGAMAMVYKAYDPSIDRTLAIKVLREEKCIDEEYRQRFIREARAAGNLSHPNIVTVYDVGETEHRPYIAMELVEGTSLDKIMKSKKQLSVEQALAIILQLARALDFAHKNGVVHRDIKPSNIIHPQKGAQIKITDFGIAHLENTDMTQHTQMGEVLGTPQYMSPEQVLGEPVDGRSDLFSVGVVLYQMLSGQKPFTGDTVASLLFQIATEDPKPIDQVVKNLPSAVCQIVDKLLRKQQSKRFQSGQDLALAITRILKEGEEQPELDTERIIPIRVRWTLIMAGLVALTLFVSLYFIYNRQYEAMTNQVIDYGGSLVKFMATESAIPMLDEDWVAIEIFIQETSQHQEFKYMTVVDRHGMVRGHTRQDQIGKPYKSPQGSLLSTDNGAIVVTETLFTDGNKIFDFKAPILFQQKEIGSVHLGMSQDPLLKVAQLTVYMMIGLMVVTIGAVAVIAYVLGKTLTGPIATLRRSLHEITNGQYESRVLQKRNDEFGQLFNSFNRMAETLQRKEEEKNSFHDPY